MHGAGLGCYITAVIVEMLSEVLFLQVYETELWSKVIFRSQLWCMLDCCVKVLSNVVGSWYVYIAGLWYCIMEPSFSGWLKKDSE